MRVRFEVQSQFAVLRAAGERGEGRPVGGEAA